MKTRRDPTVLAVAFTLTAILLSALSPAMGQSLEHFERARTLRVLQLLSGGGATGPANGLGASSIPDPAAKIAGTAAGDGAITGVVRGVDREAFASAHVVAWQAKDSLAGPDGSEDGVTTVARAQIEPDGSYLLSELAAGAYFVSSVAKGYETRYYDDAPDLGSATPVEVIDGETTEGIDFSLERLNAGTGSIAGRVSRDSDGAPIAGAVVHAFGANQPFDYVLAETDASGHYTLPGLRSGEYVVEVWSPDYLPEFYGDSPTYEEAVLVVVVEPEETTGIDFGLALGGSISGQVLDEAGSPLSGAYVSALMPGVLHRADTGLLPEGELLPVASGGWAVTGDDGFYTMAGLRTGDYRVQAQYSTRWQFVSVWYDGAPSFEQSTPIPVTAGEQIEGIDMSLQLPVARSSIAGRITDGDGRPLKAFVTVQSVVEEAFLDSLMASGDGADGPTSSSGSADAGVSGESSLIPVDDVFYPSQIWAYVVTDEQGEYVVEELPEGTYIVSAISEEGWEYVQRWYPGAESPRQASQLLLRESERLAGIDFSLPVRAATASLTGSVRNQHGEPLQWAFLELVQLGDTSGDERPPLRAYGHTDEEGHFYIDRLPAGSYQLHATYHSGEHYGQIWYDGAQDGTSATPLVLADDEELAGIDLELNVRPLYGTVTGIVTDAASGRPIHRAYVELSYLFDRDGPATDLPRAAVFRFGGHTAVTDESGRFHLAWVPEGTYSLTVYANGGAQDYVHPDTDALSTPFRVVGGERTERDVALKLHQADGGSISGAVSLGFEGPVWIADDEPLAGGDADDGAGGDDVTGSADIIDGGPAGIDVAAMPVEIAVVIAHPAGTTDLTRRYVGVTAPDGSFSLRGLPSGDYTVMCFAPGHIGMYYEDQYAPDLAQVITVEEMQHVDGIDFELAGFYHVYAAAEDAVTGDLGAPADEASRTAPAVDGQVIDDTGNPVPGATVYLLDASERPVAFAQTGQDGQFELAGIAPGEYRVYASRVGFAGSYNGGEDRFADADLLQLTGGRMEVNLTLRSGIVTAVEEDADSEGATPMDMVLHRNYPNPFNPETRITYSVPSDGDASLAIYNAVGQRVAILHQGAVEAGRVYQVTFRASGLASGVYFYTLKFADQHVTRSMMLVR